VEEEEAEALMQCTKDTSSSRQRESYLICAPTKVLQIGNCKV